MCLCLKINIKYIGIGVLVRHVEFDPQTPIWSREPTVSDP